MASQTIDRLQVEIEASAKSLSTVFSQLQTHLSQLQKTINSIDTSKLTAISKSTNSVSINTSGISKAEKDISNSVSKIQQSLAGLESYKNAALSGDSSSLTSFNRRVISIQSSIDVLREKFSQLGDTRVETTAFTNLKTQSDELQAKLDGLKTKMDDVLNGNTSVSNQAFQQLTDDIVTTRTELESVNTQMAEMVANGTATTDPFASYRDSLEEVQSALNATNAEVQNATANMNNNSPNIDTKAAQESLETLTSTIKDTASSLWDLTKSGITAGIDGLKSSFSALSTVVSGVKTGVTTLGSAFSSGVSKILKYGFGIRSTYVLFRRLRSYVVDAFTELQNSGAYFETTNANVDALSNSLSTLKYQFGAAFEPIFNTVAPALQTLINYLVAVMNTISAFIAKLTGGSTYSKAVVATSEIADNTGSAASSAEDLNKQLQGFDELNNLSGDDDSGSGGSGSSSSDDSTVTYVEESVESALTTFWDSLYDAISSGDWWKVGSLISEELTSALNSIDWTSIFQTASDFGTNFASFLNGLISDDLFSALGTTIANSIKTALFAALSFSEKFSWSGLGSAIASGINSFMEENPLSLAVDTANSWINGILEALVTAVDQTSWSTLSTHISDAIGKIDAEGFGEGVGSLVSELANAVYTLVSNKETWTNLGTKIGDGINGFFSSMGEADNVTGLTGWEALGKTISDTFTGIGTAIITALDTVNWVEVGKGIADFISNIEWEDVWFTFTELLDAIKEAIKDILDGADIDASDIAMGIAIGTLTITAVSALKTLAGLVLPSLSSLSVKVAALAVAATSVKLAEVDLGDFGANSLADALAGVGFYVAGRMLGWSVQASVSLAIVAFLVSFLADTDVGYDVKMWIYDKLGLLERSGYTLTDNQKEGLKIYKEGKVELDFTKFETKDSSDSGWTAWANSFEQKYTKMAEKLGINIADGVPTGMSDEFNKNSTFQSPVKTAWDNIAKWFEDIFDMHSPSKAMKPYGENIILGVIDGFKSKFESFGTAIGTLKDNIVSWFSEKFSGFSISDYLGGWTDTDVTVSATLGTPKSTLKGWGDAFNNNITSKWVTTKADVSADLGGDLEDNGINTFSTWETIFSNFKSIWTGTSATFKAKTGGEISSIFDLTTWQTTFENLYNAWQSKKAEFTAKYGSGTSAKSIGDMQSIISGLTGAWFSKDAWFTAGYGKNTSESTIGNMKSVISGLTGTSGLWHSVEALFTAKYGNNTSPDIIDKMKSKIGELTGAWFGQSASFTATFNQTTETMQSYADAITAIYDSWEGRSASFTISANTDNQSLENAANTIVSKIKSKLSGTIKFTAQEKGGVLTNGGWKSIPQYAGGTLDTGSLFFAGEKSGNPELVGHVNGRTEVLNKSQIASVMYASMSQAMRNFGTPTSPSSLAVNSSGYTPYSGSTGGRSNSDMLIMEQNRLLQEQNRLLEEIASKETTIPISDIFSAIQSENNNYYNRTGSSAFVF